MLEEVNPCMQDGTASILLPQFIKLVPQSHQLRNNILVMEVLKPKL